MSITEQSAEDLAERYTAWELDQEMARRIAEGATAWDPEVRTLHRAYQMTRRLGLPR